MSRTINTIHARSEFRQASSSASPRRGSLLVRIVDRLLLWQERAQARRHLAEMPDYILHDIGVTRAGAEEEAKKPFWKA